MGETKATDTGVVACVWEGDEKGIFPVFVVEDARGVCEHFLSFGRTETGGVVLSLLLGAERKRKICYWSLPQPAGGRRYFALSALGFLGPGYGAWADVFCVCEYLWGDRRTGGSEGWVSRC